MNLCAYLTLKHVFKQHQLANSADKFSSVYESYSLPKITPQMTMDGKYFVLHAFWLSVMTAAHMHLVSWLLFMLGAYV